MNKAAKSLDTKDLAPIKAQASKALSFATNLEITNDKDEIKAAAELTTINKIGDNVAEKKEAIMRPLLDAQKATRELFKPIEDNVKNAVIAIKEKLAKYHNKKVAEEEKAKAKIADRVDKGTLTTNTAVKKLGEIESTTKNIELKNGGITYKKVRKVRFLPIEKLQDKQILDLAKGGYLIWDEVKARKDALANIAVHGVEVYEDTQIDNER